MNAANRGRITAEILEIATRHGSVEQRAQALLEPLASLLRYDAAWISLLDPEQRSQRTVAFEGYPERVRNYFNGPSFMAELELVGMHGRRPPIRAKDCPVPVVELEAWADYLAPSGFNEGLAVPLLTPDGRYLGMFGSHTESGIPASDDLCDELERLAPLIAHAVDPMRSVSALATLVGDAVAGVVLTRGGHLESLPGLPGDPLVDAGSPLPFVAASALRGRLQAVFLAPCGDDSLVRVIALACPPQPPGHHRAVVLLAPPPYLHGLTHRELQVLGLLVHGCTNATIAGHLNITMRTTIGHVEHVMTKLGATSRTIAALRADREGLYIPAGLTLRAASEPPRSPPHVPPPAHRSRRPAAAANGPVRSGRIPPGGRPAAD